MSQYAQPFEKIVSVRILITGGTFDKEYDEITGELYFKDTHMGEILNLGRSRLDVKIKKLMLIDSLDMTDDDRKVILDSCITVDEEQIVITHGTDTLIKTGKFLEKNLNEKLVILTGALRPERFTNSDAALNIGTAIGAANILSKGIYIAMNGLIQTANSAKRDKKTDCFY